MRLSNTVEVDDVKEANRLMREAIRMSATNPLTGKIDMDVINTGVGVEQRRLRADLKREIIRKLDGGERGIKWTEALNALNQQSSVRVDPGELAEVVNLLELEGLVKVLGERERMIRPQE